MAVPKRRSSRSKQKIRAMSKRWLAPLLKTCPDCGAAVPGHGRRNRLSIPSIPLLQKPPVLAAPAVFRFPEVKPRPENLETCIIYRLKVYTLMHRPAILVTAIVLSFVAGRYFPAAVSYTHLTLPTNREV